MRCPLAVRIHLTLVHAAIDGDVRFPEIDPGEWRERSRVERGADARNPYDLSFVELTRRGAGEADSGGNEGARPATGALRPSPFGGRARRMSVTPRPAP